MGPVTHALTRCQITDTLGFVYLASILTLTAMIQEVLCLNSTLNRRFSHFQGGQGVDNLGSLGLPTFIVFSGTIKLKPD